MSTECRVLSQAMQEKGNEIRTFMPRYGVINERRNQLHEVIRLSGMNLIINDNDHQLIIKVASIPAARVQVYFIDNDDYFFRKGILSDSDTHEFYGDNDERAIFFSRGVLETVRKLRWQPSIVHCHGWFSSLIPVCLRNSFADDPLFKKLKIVVSLYDDGFEGTLDPGFRHKLKSEGLSDKKLEILTVPSYQNLMKFVIDYADGVMLRTGNPDPGIMAHIRERGKKVLDYIDPADDDYLNAYQKFYEELL